MKLDMDCVRNILLFCENADTSTQPIGVEEISASCQGRWSDIDLKYCISKMTEGGLLETENFNKDQSLAQQKPFIFSITWNGHQFLENVRDEKRWKTTGKILSAVRNYSLEAISAVSKGVTEVAISHALAEYVKQGL